MLLMKRLNQKFIKNDIRFIPSGPGEPGSPSKPGTPGGPCDPIPPFKPRQSHGAFVQSCEFSIQNLLTKIPIAHRLNADLELS